jgi:hypothetical protein
VKREGLLAVAALLAAGILAAAGAAWLRQRGAAPADPGSRLPSHGLLISVRGEDLGATIPALGDSPVYRQLIGTRMSDRIRRELRWGPSLPSPFSSLPPAAPSAVGLYRKGWIVVRPEAAADSASPRARREGTWSLFASDASFLPRLEAPRKGPGPPLRRGEIEVELDGTAWGGAAPGTRGELENLLPRRAAGRLLIERGHLKERWEIRCGDGCLLDMLDPAGSVTVEARGWAALPDATAAIAWFRLDPGRLAEAGGADSGAGGIPALTRLEQLERFLGIPLRKEMAAALAGPGLAALVETGNDSEPRLFLALDLADPERARRALNRIAALGVLSGAIREHPYRGVSIASWARHSRSSGIEPAAAVDGGILLLALRSADIADAIDRLRAPARRATAGLRDEIAALERGSWRAVSRSASLTEQWEKIVGGDAPSTGARSGPTRATLRKEGGLWILEGSGSAPSFAADPVLPSIRRLLRGTFDRERP